MRIDHPSEAELVRFINKSIHLDDYEEIDDHLNSCPECDALYTRLCDALVGPEQAPDSSKNVDLWKVPWTPVFDIAEDLLDGYEIFGVLGKGGMGTVYFARSRKYGLVALKVLLSDAFASPEAVVDAKREAREAQAAWDDAVAQGNPNPPYIRVFEVGETNNGVHFLSMEVASEGTLEDRMIEFRGEWDLIAGLLAKVALAVGAMHVREVVHRDITLRNILLRKKPGTSIPTSGTPLRLDDIEPALADWGLSKRFGGVDPTRPEWEENQTASYVIKGTGDFIAPELIREGSRVANAQSDIYSLGVVLYRMLTGKKLFGNKSDYPLLEAIVSEDPSQPRGINRAIPNELEAICLKCLEKKPKDRFTTAEELADELRRFVARTKEDPVKTRRPNVVRRTGRWCRKNPWAVGAFCVLVLAVGYLLRELHLSNELLGKNAEIVKIRDRSIHDQQVQSARNAVRRGDWPTALKEYELAIKDRLDDAPRLRVERLFGFFAVNDEASLVKELIDLAPLSDSEELAAPLSLVRGAYMLCDPDRQAEARETIKQAIKTSEALLSDADRAFAEALIESEAARLIAGLRKVLALDGTHYQARANLVIALLGSGQPDAAKAESEIMGQLFNESPVPPFTDAVVALLYGDRNTMRAGIAATGQRLKIDVAPLSTYLEAVADALDIMARCEDIQGNLPFIDRVRLGLLLPKMYKPVVSTRRALAFSMPSVNLMFKWYSEVFAAAYERDPADEGVYRRLLALRPTIPEAMIPILIAGNRLVAATKLVMANDLPGSTSALSELADLAYDAAVAPTLMVRSPLRYQSRLIGMLADVSLLKFEPNDEHHREMRIRDNLYLLIKDGRRWPGSRRQCITYFHSMVTSSITPELASNWARDQAKGKESFLSRCRNLAWLDRVLLEDWLRDEPHNAEAKQFLVDLEKWSRDIPIPKPLPNR